MSGVRIDHANPSTACLYRDRMARSARLRVISRAAQGIVARYVSHPPETQPVVVAETPEAPVCLGPKVGA